ncbi:MAG: glycosyltransferase family 9 protein [Chlamydiae bacterium]|nr:glycosyltransferase family 9 protein [Chlamydiota bacterium]
MKDQTSNDQKEIVKKLAFELYQNGEIKAAKELAKSIVKYENDFSIILLLARIHHDEKEFQDSLRALDFLLSHVEDDNLLSNKAKCLYYLKKANESQKILESLSEQNDDTKIDLSLYKNAQGDFKSSFEILKTLPQTDHVCFNSGWHYLQENKFKEGFKNLVRGANLRVWGNEWELERQGITKENRWDGKEKVDTLCYYLEGGIGDQFIFLRYTQIVEKYCDEILLFASKPIVNFLKECGYKNVYPHTEVMTHAWDKYVPSMSAPYILELEDPCQGIYNLNYLKKKSNPVPELNKIANGKKKICIRWKGNPEFEHEQFRTVPVEKLLSLEKYGQLFSLQIEDSDLPKNANVWDLSHLINSWSDTYDILQDADLIVTSCTAVAHLAAIMGKKVIVIVPLVPYVIWASDEINWYGDNVAIVRQTQYNSWDSAIQNLHKLLTDEKGNFYIL